jgi:Protein of unknown function (DUF1706)
MSNRAYLLALMAESWADLQEEIAKVRNQFEVEAKNGWRMKDTVAHIAVWERMAARKIAKAPLPEGEEFAAERPWSLSRFNKAMVDLWRPRSADEVLAELVAAHEALVRAIEETDEAGCAPGKRRWNTIHVDGAGHYSAHFPIRDRLAEARRAASVRS